MQTLLLSLLVFSLSCGGGTQTAQPSPTPTPAAPTPEQNAGAIVQSATCALLSAADFESVQGEPYASAQGSEHLSDGLVASQCFYRAQTFGKSIILEVVRLDAKGGAPDAIKKYWRERFHPEVIEKRERERERMEEIERKREEELEREKASGNAREGGHGEEEENEDESPPQRVAGLGEAAFWSGNEKSVALSVLKSSTVIRLSVSGEEDTPAKIKRASALARKILKHF